MKFETGADRHYHGVSTIRIVIETDEGKVFVRETGLFVEATMTLSAGQLRFKPIRGDIEYVVLNDPGHDPPKLIEDMHRELAEASHSP